MKKNLLFLALLVSFTGFSQGVTVNSSYTNSQLVNFLVRNSCLAQISNINSYTGTNAGYTQGNGLGYFQNTSSSFPIQSGVMLTTGNAMAAQGPNNTSMSFSSPLWNGDADLESFIPIPSKNATSLQFDFVAATDQFSVNFLFASEEYGSYQCDSNDGFVFLIRDLTDGTTYENVAVIPSTTLPVTVGNIRNNLYNSGCPSANPSFFGQFNGGGSAPTAATNFEGRTVLMNASKVLIPDHQYRIKIVIADDGGNDGTDGTFDSAVFFPEGSFNLGQNVFPENLTVANGNALCFGESYALDTGLSGPEYSFSWAQGSNPIAGTGPSIVVNQAGTYSVTITRSDISCSTIQTVNVEYVPQIVPGTPNALYACQSTGGMYTYDLSLNTPVVKQGLNPATIVTYYATQLEAEQGTATPLPLTYSSPGNQTVWVRVKSHNSSCYTVSSFQLLTQPAPTANQPIDLSKCESSIGLNTAFFNLSQQNAAILGSQSLNENTITYYTSLQEAQDGTPAINNPDSYESTSRTIYARIHRNFDPSCFSITTFQITVNPIPPVSVFADETQCDTFTLPALAAGENYYTQSGGNGTMLAQGDAITSSQTIYVYVETPEGCSNESSFYVDILTSSTAPADVVACESYELPALPSGWHYYPGAAGAGTEIPAGTIITTTQTIYIFVPAASACTQDNSFDVTITTTPVVTVRNDEFSCGPYTLPALPNGENYYSQTGGAGAIIPAGTNINSTQTIYIYTSNINNPACTAESSFTVTVNIVDVGNVADVQNCGNYTLPPLTVGNYYTGPGGTGTQLNAGSSITTTQTLYVYAQSTVDPTCFDEESFLVTINPLPVLSNFAPIQACVSYTLPNTLPSYANYRTGPAGTGVVLPAGTEIFSSQTIYVWAVSAEGCVDARSFTVTILDVNPLNPGDQSHCYRYTLPPLSLGNYYTGPNGTGTQLAPGTDIFSSQTIYIRAVSNSNPPCAVETSFNVTITPVPNIPVLAPVVACDSYALPALTEGSYYTGHYGTGTMYPAGTSITSSQTLYAYASNGPCSRERELRITILNSSGTIAPASTSVCGSYVLPTLPIGNYFTQPNGGGSQLQQGSTITTTQTLYVYTPVTSGPNCTSNDSFTVTITPYPVITFADPSISFNEISCTNYTLPVLNVGNYYTLSGGPGVTGQTMLSAGDVITTPGVTTLYIYAEASTGGGPVCPTEEVFTVDITTIDVNDLPDQLVCGGFELPAIPLGNYFSGSGGTGTAYQPGDIISTNQTVYIYASTSPGAGTVCSDEESFTVTIKPDPPVDVLSDVYICGSYTLPALTDGNYFTGSGGTGTPLFAGDQINTDQDIYIYNESGGIPNCPAESMFSVYINPGPPSDRTECGSYTLPVLPVGKYYTQPAGGGVEILPGTIISTTQDIYVYIAMSITPNCTDNNKFTVTINPYPVLDPVNSVYEVCDSYQLPPLSVGNYYTQPNGNGTVLFAGDLVTTTSTIYIYAETGTFPNCHTETQFDVIVHVTPVADARSKVTQCDQYELTPLLVGNYYKLPGGPNVPGQVAYSGGDGASIPGDIITQTMTMYIYAESATNPACYSENSFEIEILYIDVDQPAPVTVCDSYVLPALNVGDYYTLPGGPNVVGQTMLNAGDVITTPGVTTLYIYAELGGRVNCNDEYAFTITLYETPVVDSSQNDFSVCDGYILPALTVGDYYTGPNGTGSIIPANTNITSTQTIYIYASADPNGQCYDEHSYLLTVNTIDVGNFNDLYSCGDYILPPLAVGNYFTAANGGGTMLAAGTPITTTQTIYVYGETNTTPNCTDEDSFLVTIVTPPVGITPAPYAECGDSGYSVFDLANSMNEALGTQPNVAVTIHETENDAIFNHDAITATGTYQNVTPYNQTLYIRLESTLAPDCYDIVELQIIVNDIPGAVVPSPYNICDFDSDGNGIFDLTTKEAEVLGTLNPALHTVSYYQDAAETILIGSPSNYSSPSATIYVRVTDIATGCFKTVPLELIVNPLPTVTAPAPYTLCDMNNPGDEKEIFDLTTQIPTITGGVNGMVVTFHYSLLDAQQGTGEITTPEAYENQTTVETLFVRVTDEDTNCFSTVLLDIRVEPLPQLDINALTPDDTTVCDPDGNGFATFNLDDIANIIMGTGTNLVVKFYETVENAEDDQDEITNTSSYTNVIPLSQTIYIRVENTLTGCYRTESYSISLTVIPSPQIPDLQDLKLCDEDVINNQDGITSFDLTEQNNIIDPAGANGYIINYFTQRAYAEAGAPKIITPTDYDGYDGEEIWVRVEDPVTGCFGIESFMLEVYTPLALTTPTPYVLCDEELPNNGQTTFNLTSKNNEILGPNGVGLDYTVDYFESQADMNAGIVISDPEHYVNLSTPKTLWVMVTTTDGCRSYTTLTIKVLPLPVPDFNPAPIERCDNYTTPDGQESFDLTEAENEIRNNDANAVITYYTNINDAEAGTNAIPDPTDHVSGNAIVYVRVEAYNTNLSEPRCHQIVELELIVNPFPAIANSQAVKCQLVNTGIDTFLLSDYYNDILGSANPAGYTITFHTTLAFAQAGTPAMPNQYTNVIPFSETIYVRVENNTTGCISISTFDLLVEQQAVANPVTNSAIFEVCDDQDGVNDGKYTFDLTLVEPDVLGTQNPAIHSFTYYESSADAVSGTNAIPNPGAYENTLPGLQEIWVRIENTSTTNGCPDYTSFYLDVESLPIPLIEDGAFCLDAAGNTISTYILSTGLDPIDYTFVWTKDGTVLPDTGAELFVDEKGTYTVVATSTRGCVSDPVSAVVEESGPASIIGDGFTVNNAFSDNQTITIDVEGYGNYSFSLDGGPWQTSNVFTDVTAGPHSVLVRAEKGNCADTLIIDISIINYPKFFTPNQDNYNDTWNIIGLGDQAAETKIYIFDRYGKLLKQISSSEDSMGWDGTFNGTPLPADDYWFTVTYRENGVVKEFKSHFTLKR